jgi:hypothetical protein
VITKSLKNKKNSILEPAEIASIETPDWRQIGFSDEMDEAAWTDFGFQLVVYTGLYMSRGYFMKEISLRDN